MRKKKYPWLWRVFHPLRSKKHDDLWTNPNMSCVTSAYLIQKLEHKKQEVRTLVKLGLGHSVIQKCPTGVTVAELLPSKALQLIAWSAATLLAQAEHWRLVKTRQSSILRITLKHCHTATHRRKTKHLVTIEPRHIHTHTHPPLINLPGVLVLNSAGRVEGLTDNINPR